MGTGTQSRIGKWHRRTFGQYCSRKRLFDKLAEEFAEFIGSCGEPSEAADIVIVLMAHASRNGYDLMQEVERKFSEVSKRTDQLERDSVRGITEAHGA